MLHGQAKDWSTIVTGPREGAVLARARSSPSNACEMREGLKLKVCMKD